LAKVNYRTQKRVSCTRTAWNSTPLWALLAEPLNAFQASHRLAAIVEVASVLTAGDTGMSRSPGAKSTYPAGAQFVRSIIVGGSYV
jgi:hypothetical protein